MKKFAAGKPILLSREVAKANTAVSAINTEDETCMTVTALTNMLKGG